jgi:hypothetical protein
MKGKGETNEMIQVKRGHKFFWVNNNLGGRKLAAVALIAPLTKRRRVKTAVLRRLFSLDTPSICDIISHGEQQTTKKVIYPIFSTTTNT